MKRALLVVHTQIYFPRMLELGCLLQRTGRFQPVYYLAYKGTWQNLSDSVRQLREEGLAISSHCRIAAPAKPAEPSIESASWRQRLKGFLPRRPRQWLARSVVGIYRNIADVLHLVRRVRSVTAMLEADKIDVVVLSLDVATFDTACFVKAAHQNGKPAVVAISCTRAFEEALEVYAPIPALSCDRWLNALVGILYPKWQAEYKGRKFLLLPGLHVLVREVLGLAPPLPWVEGSSRAEVVLAENEKFLEEGLSVGLRSDRLRLTGQPIHDEMAATLTDASGRRERLYAQLGLPPGKPMMLSSLIPDYGRDRPGSQFANHHELVAFWINTVASLNDYNHVITLHPSMNPTEFRWIEGPGVRISRSSIAELLPLCRIFVTSVSSVMSYATACGKPVVNYDAFRYRNTMFANEPGIITIETKDEFIAEVNKLASDPEYFDMIARHQAAAAPRWGRLDGKATERIVAVLDELIAARHGSVPA